jgi:hypothetical protein
MIADELASDWHCAMTPDAVEQIRALVDHLRTSNPAIDLPQFFDENPHPSGASTDELLALVEPVAAAPIVVPLAGVSLMLDPAVVSLADNPFTLPSDGLKARAVSWGTAPTPPARTPAAVRADERATTRSKELTAEIERLRNAILNDPEKRLRRSDWEIENWAKAQHIPARRKAVLIVLAIHANKEGYAWPHVETIGTGCGIKPRAVLYNLAWLQRAGLVAVFFRKDEKGRAASKYLLPFWRGVSTEELA